MARVSVMMPRRMVCSNALRVLAFLAGCALISCSGPLRANEASSGNSDAPSSANSDAPSSENANAPRPEIPLDWDTAPRPIIIGHRGVGNVGAPENTIPAFDIAAANVDGIETDMYTSADGEPVLIHDENTLRTTGVAGDVLKMKLEDIEKLNAAAGWSSYSSLSIPTLSEYLERYSARSLLLPEIKGGDVDAMARRLAAFDQRTILVHSFSAQNLTLLKRALPGARIQLLTGIQVPIDDLTALGVWSVGLERPAVTADYVARCHAAGIRVLVWVVDDVESARALTDDDRVDGIITDDPVLMRREFLPGRR